MLKQISSLVFIIGGLVAGIVGTFALLAGKYDMAAAFFGLMIFI